MTALGSEGPLHTSAASVAEWPHGPGVYVVWQTDDSDRPLYVGKAADLHKRWRRNHLANRSNTSALRRSLAIHLQLVSAKLKRGQRAHPAPVEDAITDFLERCSVELHPVSTRQEAAQLEQTLIESMEPLLNIQRRRRTPSSVRRLSN